jgi:DNA polymerase-3 subunit delta
LSAWIEQEASRRGGKIDRKAAEYIVEHSAEDMWHINSALDQMVAFKKTEPITAKDVGWFVSEQAEESVFKIVEAIVGSNGKQAYKFLTEQSSNFDGGYLLGLLIWQLRILIEMRDLFEREDNVTSNELAKKLKINPYVAKKNLALVKQQPLFKLKHSYQELLEIDRKIKTGQLDQSLVVDMCILKLS